MGTYTYEDIPKKLKKNDIIRITTTCELSLPPGLFHFKAHGSARSSTWGGNGSICTGTLNLQYFEKFYCTVNKSMDVRIRGNQLRDRIMVAGSGGGYSYKSKDGRSVTSIYGRGGNAGLIGTAGANHGSTTGGKGATKISNGDNGKKNDYYSNTGGITSNQGLGYYNGGNGGYTRTSSPDYFYGGGGGGSCFISGHDGCNAVDIKNKHTGQPIHFSGVKFYDTSIESTTDTSTFLEITVLDIYPIYKFLIKQSKQYYTIKSEFYSNYTYNSLNLEGEATPNDSDYENFGFSNINDLCTETVIGEESFRPIDVLKKNNDGKFDILMKEIE